MVSKIPLGPLIQPVMIPYPNETFITHGASAVFSGFDSGTGTTVSEILFLTLNYVSFIGIANKRKFKATLFDYY